jgi:hypothetical protein
MPRGHEIPSTHAQASELFAASARYLSDPVRLRGVETYLEKLHGFDEWAFCTYAVTYRGTAVVTFHPNGQIELNDGGWRSATTKLRMNQALIPNGFRLYQEKHEWFISGWRADLGPWPYENGMRVDPETGPVAS